MGAVTVTIISDGETMDPAYEILSLEVSKEVNRIPTAQITLADGNVSRSEFPVSNSPVFEPGKEVEIKLRYEGEEDASVFKGMVLSQGIRASSQGSILQVDLKDKAFKLTRTRRNVVYRELTDTDIMTQIIDNAGLTTGDTASTQTQHSEIVQYNSTDWDFMLTRTDLYGLVVNVDDGSISLNEVDLSGDAVHTFKYGLSELYDFEFELDASYQHASIDTVSWDITTQEISEPSAAEEFALSQGNLQGGTLAETLGFEPCHLSHPVPLDSNELQGWANGRLLRSRMAMIKGRLSVRGDGTLKPLDVIQIDGTSDRFNGKTLISGVRHVVDEQGWQTDIQFGLSQECFSQQPDIQDVPSAGLLPAISGLQIGIVDAFEEDPDEQLRVRIKIPAIDTENGVVWARLATPEAGLERGYFFRPEPGDEVVVGFFNNDPRRAVILGAMYSTTNTAPADFAELTEDNLHKGIVTKKGTKISFIDDEMASVSIETPESNKFTLSDDTESIELSDQHGNSVLMNSDGIASTDLNGNSIVMNSDGIELIDANGNSIIMGSGGVEIVSASDCKVEGSGNVEISGSAVDVM